MQTDHRVPTTNTAAMRQEQQHRKRSFSGVNHRKRDRHDLICVVCHAPAMGYNFDQITCESCKAFFRRNALNNADKFQCRSGTSDCLITLATRKRCKACRLKKCFEKGLRKEWIMSEEEKLTKKQKIEDNRRLRAMSQNSSMFAFTPSSSPPTVPETESFHFPADYRKRHVHYEDEDTNDVKPHIRLLDETNDSAEFKLIEELLNNQDRANQNVCHYKTLLNASDRALSTKIEEDYARAVQLNISIVRGHQVPRLRSLNDVVDVANEPGQMSSLRIITFLKLTPEFNTLHEDDRLVLVKHNLLSVLCLHLCMCVDMDTQIYREPYISNDFCYHASELRRYSDQVYHLTMALVKEVQQLTCNDHLIIKLMMLIMIFSKGSDLNEPILLEPRKIFQAQNVFVDLLWNYLNVRFGVEKTPAVFSRLIRVSMQAQLIGRETKNALSKQTVHNEQLAPLMQSVLLNSS